MTDQDTGGTGREDMGTGGVRADIVVGPASTLRDGTDRVIARIAQVIDDGVADGSLPALEALPVAQTLYQLWLGASLIGKLHRDRKSLENAMAFTQKLLNAE